MIIDDRVYNILIKQREVHHVCPVSWCSKPYHFTELTKIKIFAFNFNNHFLAKRRENILSIDAKNTSYNF